MPPFASPTLPSQKALKNPKSQIVTINVGGTLFQTTLQTVALAGPTSLLSDPPPFIDRDPHLFSLLLSLLRTNRLPSNNSNYSLPALFAEAEFYNIDLNPFLNPSLTRFDAYDLKKSHLLPLNGRDLPTAVATDESGAVHVAHGGKVTSFDWSLTSKSTLLTRFPAVDSLHAVGRNLIAAGAVDFPGLQILSVDKLGVRKTLHWNVIGSGSAVQAIGSSPDYLFGSFESVRRNSSAILAFDRTNFKEVMEIGRKDVYGAELDTAIPPTKLKWVDGFKLLLAAGSHAAPSGLTGNVRLWDVRSGSTVYELTEKMDCFADVAVSDALSSVFKVGVSSGDLFMKDLRKLNEDWICIGRKGSTLSSVSSKSGNNREGLGCLVECYGDKVFVSRGGDVEIWSEVMMGGGIKKNEDGVGVGERVMRKNLMGRREDFGGKKIVKLGFGGRRMVVLRKEEHCVELWDGSSSR